MCCCCQNQVLYYNEHQYAMLPRWSRTTGAHSELDIHDSASNNICKHNDKINKQFKVSLYYLPIEPILKRKDSK